MSAKVEQSFRQFWGKKLKCAPKSSKSYGQYAVQDPTWVINNKKMQTWHSARRADFDAFEFSGADGGVCNDGVD